MTIFLYAVSRIHDPLRELFSCPRLFPIDQVLNEPPQEAVNVRELRSPRKPDLWTRCCYVPGAGGEVLLQAEWSLTAGSVKTLKEWFPSPLFDGLTQLKDILYWKYYKVMSQDVNYRNARLCSRFIDFHTEWKKCRVELYVIRSSIVCGSVMLFVKTCLIPLHESCTRIVTSRWLHSFLHESGTERSPLWHSQNINSLTWNGINFF